MRKIRTQAEIDRKNRRNQIIIGVVMIFLLLASTLGYSLMSSDSEKRNRVSENEVDFVFQNGLWMAEIDGAVFGFQNLPSEVVDIEVNGSFSLSEYSNQVLYIVNSNSGTSELLNNIGSYILRPQDACLDNETCGGDWPVKDCKSNLIIFESGNRSKVYQNESCVYISGDVIRATDAFLYELLGVN